MVFILQLMNTKWIAVHHTITFYAQTKLIQTSLITIIL